MSERWSWEVEPLDCRIVRESDGGCVVADLRVPLSEGCAEAAELIASAPDLKRALVNLLRYCATNSGDNFTPSAAHNIFAAARAAVRRSEPKL